ncbi:replication initiator protein A [Staphylococcus capitis]|uniref:replication initiator protein A n=1 Tax=Staphylococcus capitis TaxID=29388 RepID=UPI003219A4E2
MNNNKQFYTIEESYKERFFRLPKVFFTNPNYMKLKNVSKIAYAILQDRLQLSIKNKWVDDAGRIYFVYTDKKLMEILNISKNHVTTVKKELINVGLLIQKRQGLNKPNISYLLKPEITHEDIYKIETAETDVETSDDTDSHTVGIQNHTQWESRITHSGNPESHTVGTNDTDISDTDISDTDDMNDMYNQESNTANENQNLNHSNHSNHLDKPTDSFNHQNVEQEILLQNLPETIQMNLKYFSNSEIRCIKDVMNKAKAHYNTHAPIEERITFEDCGYEMGEALRRIKLFSRQKNENVCDLEAYMMQTFKRVFVDYIRNLQQLEYAENDQDENASMIDFKPQNDIQAMAKRMFMNHY